jgi:hypothetical protein
MAEKQGAHKVTTNQLDIHHLLRAGKINNELDYERAMIAERKLRVLAKEDPRMKSLRFKLRNLIEVYESKNWSDAGSIDKEKIKESDLAELIAEREREFLANRKTLIKNKLKSMDMTQQQLGELLGHHSKTYMSELINGISPFSLKDLVTISLVFKINIKQLVPVFLSAQDYPRIITVVKKLRNPHLKLKKEDLVFA